MLRMDFNVIQLIRSAFGHLIEEGLDVLNTVAATEGFICNKRFQFSKAGKTWHTGGVRKMCSASKSR